MFLRGGDVEEEKDGTIEGVQDSHRFEEGGVVRGHEPVSGEAGIEPQGAGQVLAKDDGVGRDFFRQSRGCLLGPPFAVAIGLLGTPKGNGSDKDDDQEAGDKGAAHLGKDFRGAEGGQKAEERISRHEVTFVLNTMEGVETEKSREGEKGRNRRPREGFGSVLRRARFDGRETRREGAAPSRGDRS